jgi:hypothetical protein
MHLAPQQVPHPDSGRKTQGASGLVRHVKRHELVIHRGKAVPGIEVCDPLLAKMLQELKSLPLLTGYRGTEPADLDRVVDVITGIAGLAHALGDDVDELEVNPLRIRGSRVEVLDSLVRWRQDVPALNGQAR